MVCPVKQINASFQQMEIFLFKNISTRLDEFLQIVSSNLHKRLKQFVQKYVKTSCNRTSAVLSKFPFLTRTLIPYWYIQITLVPQKYRYLHPQNRTVRYLRENSGCCPLKIRFKMVITVTSYFPQKKYTILLCVHSHILLCVS